MIATKTDKNIGRHLRQLRDQPANFYPLPRGQPEKGRSVPTFCYSYMGSKLKKPARAPPTSRLQMVEKGLTWSKGHQSGTVVN